MLNYLHFAKDKQTYVYLTIHALIKSMFAHKTSHNF